MSTITVAPGANVDADDFWVQSGTASTQERFEDQTALSGSLVLGIGPATATFSEYVFEKGDFTFRYVGEWEVEVNGGVLASTTSAQGTYDKVVIEKNGEAYATLTLDSSLAVDFGSQTGIDLLGLGLDDLTNPLISLLLGNAGEGAIENLHLLASPDLPDLAGDADVSIHGTTASETITGTAGIDTIDAREGNDVVFGLAGNDTIYGRSGNDRLFGDAGNDLLIGGQGADQLDGGAGRDTASYTTATAGLVASLTHPSSNTGDAKGDTYTSIENLIGTRFSDSLTGNTINNRLDGGSGNDRLFGGSGNDSLFGGSGNDQLTGGAGLDKLIGGSGADQFIFTKVSDSTATTSGRDMILDFARTLGDKINLSAIDANTSTAGNQAFTFIGTHGFSDKAGELRYGIVGDLTFISGDVIGDGTSDFRIGLDRSIALISSDFLL